MRPIVLPVIGEVAHGVVRERVIDVGVGVYVAALELVGLVIHAGVVHLAGISIVAVAVEIEFHAAGRSGEGEGAVVLADRDQLDVDELLLDQQQSMCYLR